MKSFEKSCLVGILLVLVLALSGCSLLQIPGALLGGIFKVLGGVLDIAQKVPWWLWI